MTIPNRVIVLMAVVVWLLAVNITAQPFRGGASGGIYDAEGRYRIFHGTNFVLKEPPWYPEVLLNESHVAQYASWGMNSLRLGTMWTGAQPEEQGSFNQTYYDQLLAIVDLLSRHGIHAILDCHQDVLSSYFCEYDGAPRWLVNRSLQADASLAKHPFPYPFDGAAGCAARPWAENYLTLACGRAFQDIYENRHGNRDAFAAFWAHTASLFANASFLGYELWNEPWCGDFYEDPALLLPGGAGRVNLQPLYEHLFKAINQHDAQHLVLFEPVTWSVIFNGTLTGTGFTRVPGGDPSRTAMAWHYYCWFFSEQRGGRRLCDHDMGPKAFDSIESDLLRLQTGGFLTEWGLCDPSQPNGLEECQFVMSLADRHAMSWTNWDWGAGQLQFGWLVDQDWVAAMVRPYVQAYAGLPISIDFDPQTLNFTTLFTLDPSVQAETILYVPSLHYPAGGFSLQTQCLLMSSISADLQYYSFTSQADGCQVATIVLSPKTLIGSKG